jgi:hypothetical protein
MAKKPIKKTKAKREGTKETEYVNSLDLLSWWEDFSLSTTVSGAMKYKTVFAFISKKTSTPWQKNLLWWMLGPSDDNIQPLQKEHNIFPQLDWERRRTNGHWNAPKNLDALKRVVGTQQHALGKIAQLGDINLEIINRIQSTQRMIDSEFAAGIMLPQNNADQNAVRAQLYLNLQAQLTAQMQQAQAMFARSQGVELQQLNQFLQILGSGLANGNRMNSFGLVPSDTTDEPTKGGMRSVSTQLIDMVSRKAVDYELPLPTEEMTDVVRQAAKPTLVKKG